jgi:hypothetical protein
MIALILRVWLYASLTVLALAAIGLFGFVAYTAIGGLESLWEKVFMICGLILGFPICLTAASGGGVFRDDIE